MTRIVCAALYSGLNPLMTAVHEACVRRGLPSELFLAADFQANAAVAKSVGKLKTTDVLVQANQTQFHIFDGEPMRVFVAHGVGLAKNFSYWQPDGIGDYCVTPSAYFEKQYVDRQYRPTKEFWRDGYVGTDSVVKALAEGEEPIRVLVAPTYDGAINGGYKVWRDLTHALLERTTHKIAIKLHPLTPGYGDEVFWMRALEGHPRVKVGWTDHDIAPFIAMSKVMLSDMTSAIPMFMISGRPVVAFNSFGWWENGDKFNKLDWQFRLRDTLYQWSHIDDAVMQVDRLMTGGADPLAMERQLWVDKMFAGTLDGLTADRIAARIGGLL